MPEHWFGFVAAIASAGVQFVLFLRWLHRRMRNDEIVSAFDSLQQSAQNRLARTRNSAGFGELTDELARQKGIAEAGQAQQNQLAFSNTAFQRQMAALQGLSGLFGMDSNLLGRTLGIPAELLNVRANASRSNGGGFFSALGSGLGSTLAALPAAFL